MIVVRNDPGVKSRKVTGPPFPTEPESPKLHKAPRYTRQTKLTKGNEAKDCKNPSVYQYGQLPSFKTIVIRVIGVVPADAKNVPINLYLNLKKKYIYR